MTAEIELEVDVEEDEPFKHQLAKLVIGTVVGFLAKQGVEKLYDKILESRRG